MGIYEELEQKLLLDVRSEKHHGTATQWCSCGWEIDPVPQLPDGSGDSYEMERMARVHRLEAVMKELQVELGLAKVPAT